MKEITQNIREQTVKQFLQGINFKRSTSFILRIGNLLFGIDPP